MSNKNSDTSNSFAVYVAIGKLIAMVCNFVLPIFLTRFLTKSDYGLYSQFYSIYGFLWYVLSMGIPASLYYFYPRVDGSRRALLLNNYLIMAIVSLLGIVVVNIPYFNNLLLGDSLLHSYFYIICIYLFICIPNSLVDALAVLRKDKFIAVLFHPTEIILKGGFIIGVSLCFGELIYIFYAMCVYQLILSLFSLYYIFFSERDNSKLYISSSMLKDQINYSFPFAFAVLLNSICLYCDKILCVKFLTTEEYAIYSLAFFSIPGIRQIYDSISQVNLVNLTKAHANGDKKQIISLYNKFVVQVYSFSVPIIFIFCVFAKEIILFLFTDKYLESVSYFQIYIFTILFSFLGSGVILRAIGKTKKIFWANLIAALVYLPICYILISNFHILGAIIAAVLGVILPRLLKLIFEIQEMECGILKFFPIKDMIKIVVISFICLSPIFFLKYYFINLNIWFCFLLSFLYIILVFLCEIKMNVFLVDKLFIISKIQSCLSYVKNKKGKVNK